MTEIKSTQTRPAVLDLRAARMPARAAGISQALREAARGIRRPAVPWIVLRSVRGRQPFNFARAVLAGFIVVVLLPVLLSGLYLAFVASDQYASEARFAVRGAEQSPLSSIAGFFGVQAAGTAQDTQILVSYLKGRTVVDDISQSIDLREIYARPKVDYLSRFDPADPVEDLVKYWRWHSHVSLDNNSGVITVIVRAFTPEDSLAVANEVVLKSEKLVNDLSDRQRRDALRTARAELTRAEANLQDKTRAMSELRNTEQLLDTGKTAEVMTKMLGELRLQRIQIEQNYTTMLRSVRASAPQARVMQARIASIKDEIAKLEGQMTQTSASTTPALSESISRFGRARLEQEFAQKQYVATAAAFERARVELETQQLYLATFLKPVLAQDALYPKSGWIWSIVLAGCLALWGAGVGTAVLVRNYGMG